MIAPEREGVKRLNKIEVKRHLTPSGYEIPAFFIDGKPLSAYFRDWLSGKPEMLKRISPADDLEICWSDDYDYEGDARFMRYVLSQNQAVTPILSCPDDFDFSCIVIVADVVKKNDTVQWNRIGLVNHSEESFDMEKKSGILFTKAYTEEDWEKYGDNIALAELDSPEWDAWTSDNWSEEQFRRRVNYTYPYYQDENHIDWFADSAFEFDRAEYDQVVMDCYTM